MKQNALVPIKDDNRSDIPREADGSRGGSGRVARRKRKGRPHVAERASASFGRGAQSKRAPPLLPSYSLNADLERDWSTGGVVLTPPFDL